MSGNSAIDGNHALLENDELRDNAEPNAHDAAEFVAQWKRVCQRLQAEVGDVEYRAWLRQMSFGGVDGDEVTIRLPSRFLRDWVRTHHGERLNALWRGENPGIRRVDIRVATSANGGVFAEPVSLPGAAAAAMPRGAARGEERDPLLEGVGTLDPKFTFDSFVVGKPNEFAYACARRVAGAPATPGFNPLFLYGGVGLGKTHLMHAIGWHLLGQRGADGRSVSVKYMSSESFVNQFIRAIRDHSTIEFKGALRSVDVLMVDDLQFLIGKDATQEEFFHTFNALVEAGRQIVVSADKSPSDLSGLEERVRTRLAVGMVADLHATTFELRMSILSAKAARAGTQIPTRVLELLAHKITSNVRELEGALNRLVAHASVFNRQITFESTQEVLGDILRSHDRRISIEEIQRRVCDHYHIRLTDMASSRRARNVARPRQVAMYLAKQLTQRSLPEIGRRFGNRDHTTVMHAIQRVTELMDREASFAEDVELLRKMLESA
ncbi:MAG: chromosomal replication initiator protein DnaA [Acidisphaera sp.]|nr:chromosomal replication initiator protein DnaA [Acidisphaera sp.]MBV9811696.1 chromosomal replication initiator protein DnaA [Acetobacteraceae bacterium]